MPLGTIRGIVYAWTGKGQSDAFGRVKPPVIESPRLIEVVLPTVDARFHGWKLLSVNAVPGRSAR